MYYYYYCYYHEGNSPSPHANAYPKNQYMIDPTKPSRVHLRRRFVVFLVRTWPTETKAKPASITNNNTRQYKLMMVHKKKKQHSDSTDEREISYFEIRCTEVVVVVVLIVWSDITFYGKGSNRKCKQIPRLIMA